MQYVSSPLPDVKIISGFNAEDDRGKFVKSFHEEKLAEIGVRMTIREEFYSISSKGVLRGMHFQVPPHAHQKLVYCIRGRVLDVVLDLRKDKSTYGKFASFELSEKVHNIVYIPVGFAHGFLSLEDDSCLIYKTDHVYEPESDAGILWSSFGYDWPDLEGLPPRISDRDRGHQEFRSFHSPF
jgi:dTDP-4-dehydrorhamnose 3,5-epimerase